VLPPLPLVATFAITAFLIVRQGGSNSNAWYEASLVLLAITVVAVLAARGPVTIARELWVALAGLGAYTAWCYGSLAWSGAKGTAWDGANRTLLYLTVLAVFAFVPLRRRGAGLLLVAYGTTIASIGVYVFDATTTGSDRLQAFIGGRLADPIGYPNGNAALFMLGFWCVLPFVASQRTPVAARLLCAAVATVNIDLSLLAQSRGGLVAGVVSALVYLAFARDRVRALGALAVCAACAAIAARQLFRVYRTATSGGDLAGSLHDARLAMLLSAVAVMLVVGGMVALARLTRGRRVAQVTARVAPTALAVVAAIAVAAGLATAAVEHGRITNEARTKWHQFTSIPSSAELIRPGTSHFGSDLGAGGRYDMWRVAWAEFRSHPLVGVGVDNFASDYTRLRRSSQEPAYPHSAVLRLLSETGLVGAALFALFSIAIGWRLARSNRVHGGPVVASAIGAASYWLIHGSVDWLWEIPAVTMSALLVVGAALASSASPSGARPRLEWTGGRVFALAVGLAGAASLALPWLAIREQQVALATWRTHPADAVHALDIARNLNRLSDEPDLLAGAIAARRHDYPRATLGFTRAAGRNPAGWYAHLELGALAALTGAKAQAARELAEARRLNPTEPATSIVEAGLKQGRPVPLAQLDQLFLARVKARNWPGIVVQRR
jgi:hypothetical protein